MRKLHRRLLALAVLPAAFCGGCDPVSVRTLTMPAPAPEWVATLGPLGCEIWVGDRLRIRQATWPAALEIDASLSGPLPIVAFPLVEGIRLKPAGGFLYPEEQQACALTWIEGPIARAAHSLMVAGFDLATFDLPRLRREVRDLERPVDLDRERLVKEVASGDFRVTDIRCRPEHMVTLSLPPGRWTWDTPEREPVTAMGETTTFQAPEGFHRLFGEVRRVDLLISAAGTRAIMTERR